MSFTQSQKDGSSWGTSKIGIVLIISCLVNGNTLSLTIVCAGQSPIVGSSVRRTIRLICCMLAGARVCYNLPIPNVA